MDELPIQAVLYRFRDVSASSRTALRWAARLIVAAFVLTNLPVTPERRPATVFDSLADDLRDVAACNGRAPLWLAAGVGIGAAVSILLAWRRATVHVVLTGIGV
jgi:hypothetical protein